MTTAVLSSLRQEIVRHKALAATAACVAVTTVLLAGADLPRPGGDSSAPPSEQFAAADAASIAKSPESRDSSASDAATIDDALKFGRKSLTALKSVADYTAIFTKTELVDGKPLTQTMDIKCRRQPFSVYLGCHRRGGKGREVIYVAGSNDNHLLVHEAGFKSVIGTLKLKPDSPKVMETNRHPMTDVGLVRLVELSMGYWENDKRAADPAQMDVRFFHDVQVESVVCDEVQITHKRKNPKIQYQIGRVFVDKQTGLPVQGELYGWPEHAGEEAPLLEKYTYTNIKTNVGLKAHDFDPENPDYHF